MYRANKKDYQEIAVFLAARGVERKLIVSLLLGMRQSSTAAVAEEAGVTARYVRMLVTDQKPMSAEVRDVLSRMLGVDLWAPKRNQIGVESHR